MTPLKRAAFALTATIVTLLAFEGLASVVVVGQLALQQSRILAERVHVRYDAELGWVNIPDLFIRDMYGSGISLRTNAQGFRNDRPFPPAVPRGRMRLICSGDSFTLGYGVSNDEAWCNALEAIDPRIEAVNMGQGGYGIDQAWLWYRRDGTKLDHQVHLFAFISDDFSRMRYDSFLGYPKPVLVVEQGQLSVRNVPVPQRSTMAVRIGDATRTVADLRVAQLFRRLVWGPVGPSNLVLNNRVRGGDSDPLRLVAEKVFESLRELHAQRGSVLVLAYLPGEEEYGDRPSSPWRAVAHDIATRQGITLLDLVPELNGITRPEAETFFIKVGEAPYRDGEGHYTVRGNRFIARALYQKLSAIEAVDAKLRATSRPEP